MNKIFRVIWNHATQTWVAVSELSSAKGKTKSSSTAKAAAAAVAIAASAVAGAATTSQPIGNNAGQLYASTGDNQTIFGKNITIGKDNTPDNIGLYDETTIAIGTNLVSDGRGGIVIGDGAKALRQENPNGTILEGEGNGKSVSIGFDTVAKAQSVAIGVSAEASLNNTVAIGTKATANVAGAVAIGSGALASAQNTAAFGEGAKATAHNAFAIGPKAEASGRESTAIGAGALATDNESVAVGLASAATGNVSRAIGRAQASNLMTTAIGYHVYATGPGAMAIGAWTGGKDEDVHNHLTELNDQNKVRYGYSGSVPTVAAGAHSIAFGNTARAFEVGAIAIGGVTKAKGKIASVLGYRSSALSNFAGVFGSKNAVGDAAEGSYAIGFQNKINQNNTFVLGSNVTTTQANSVVLGDKSTDRAATAETKAVVNDVEYGSFAGVGAPENGVVSVGAAGKERQIINVAAGKIAADSTDAINGSQLYLVMDKITPAKNTVPSTSKPGSLEAPNETEAPRFVNSTVLVDAINKAGWNVNIDKAAGAKNAKASNNTGAKLVTPGDEVVFKAGDNIELERDGRNITIKSKPSFKIATDNDGNKNINAGDTIKFAPSDDGLADFKLDTGSGTIKPQLNTLQTAPIINTAGDPKQGAIRTQGNNAIGDQLVTGARLAEAVNNSYWRANIDKTTGEAEPADADAQIKAGDLVKFIAGDGMKIEIDEGNREFTFSVKPADIPAPETTELTNNANGKVNTPTDGDKLVNAATVAKAINDSGWKVTSGTEDGGEQAGTKAEEVVKPSELVSLKAGKNMKIKQTGKDFVYSTKDDVEFTTTTLKGGDNSVKLSVPDDEEKPNTLKLGGKDDAPVTIANVQDNLPGTTVTPQAGNDNRALPDTVDDIKGNAATVNDVLNAGFNLKVNDGNVDFVKAYDTVEFIDSDSTTVEHVQNGKSDTHNKIKVNVKTAKVAEDPANKGAVKVENPQNGNADEEGKKLVNATTVAEAINASGFVASIARDEEDFEDQKGDAEEVINPGDKLTFQSGKNLKVKQFTENGETKFTYATEDNVVFKNVNTETLTIGGPKGTADQPTPANQPRADISVVQGPTDVSGNEGDKKTRIQYTPVNPDGTAGEPEQLATLNDGLKFKGNTGETVKKKLNETLDIVGGLADDAEASDKNTRVDEVGGKLVVKIAEKPEFKDITLKDGNNRVNLAPVDNNTLSLGGGDQNAPVTVDNVKTTLPGTANNPDTGNNGEKTRSFTPTEAVKNDAATIDDVLQAGFNLKVNNDAVDFVKPYDTVEFIDGNGVTVEHVTEGATDTHNKIKVSVKTTDLKGDLTAVENNDNPDQPKGSVATTDEKGADGKGDKFATTNQVADAINKSGFNVKGKDKDGADTETLVNPGDNVTFGASDTADTAVELDDKGNPTVTVNVKTTNLTQDPAKTGAVQVPAADSEDGKKLVNANTVANAINESGFTATIGKDTAEFDNEDGKEDALINPGDKVVYQAGKNLKVKQEQDGTTTKFTYATEDHVKFDSVTIETRDPANPDAKPSPVTMVTNPAAPNSISFVGRNPDNPQESAPVQINNITSGLQPYNAPDNAENPAPTKGAEGLVNLNTPDIDNSNVATVGDLRNMGWVVSAPDNQYEQAVKNAEKVDFKGAGGVNVKGKTNKDGHYEIEVSLAEAGKLKLEEIKNQAGEAEGQPTPSGKVSVEGDNPNGFVGAKNVADMINGSGFKATIGRDDEFFADQDGKKDELINPGDTVALQAGQNLKVKQKTEDGVTKFTFATDENVEFSTVKVATKVRDEDGNVVAEGSPITLVSLPIDPDNPEENRNTLAFMGTTEDGKKPAPVTLTNIKSNLPNAYDKGDKVIGEDGYPTNDDAAEPTKAVKGPNAEEAAAMHNQAATVGDVLNAGWNLQGNGEPVDFVKPYDTVNFADGTGTTVEVTADKDGKVSTIKVNTVMAYTDENGNKVAKADDGKYYPVDENGKPNKTLPAVENPQVNLVNTDGSTNKPIVLGNIDSKAPVFGPQDGVVNGLINLDDVLDPNTNELAPNGKGNNAATLGDLARMGWVVKTPENGYSEQVRNAEVVNFIGSGMAQVQGDRIVDGEATVVVHVEAQEVINNAQLPVVYTNKDGDKVVKIGDNFYKADDVTEIDNKPYPKDSVRAADGNVYPAGTQLDQNGLPTDNTVAAINPLDGDDKVVKPADIIASMSNGDNETKTPMQLANVGANLPNTYNKGDKTVVGADGKEAIGGKPTGDAKAEPTKVADLKDVNVEEVFNNAATVGDVLNTGWNLQGNGEAVDFVKPYDTVNFADGTGTTVEVTADEDGKVSTIKVNTLTAYTDDKGNKVAKADDGKYYPVDENGKPNKALPAVENPQVNLVNTDGSTNKPIVLGNVAQGAKTYGPNLAQPLDDSPKAKEMAKNVSDAYEGLADLNSSNPTNVMTVADAKNMGWVVSTLHGNGYADDVRNANHVDFVGTGLATVKGHTDEATGIRVITVDVNAQNVVQDAQLPVVYTNKDGDKVIKVGDKFFKEGDVDVIDGKAYPKDSVAASNGKVYPKGTELNDQGLPTDNTAQAIEPIEGGDVPADSLIASMNNGNNETKTPMQLANVGGNLPNTYNVDAVNKDGEPVTKAQDLPEGVEKLVNNAATVGDVLNAGFNVKENGEDRDFVKPYDTVNFVNGKNTTAKVVTNDEGTASDVTFDLNDNIVLGKDGKDGVDGSIGVTGKDGASVALNGKDGSIGLRGPKGADGKDGLGADLKIGEGPAGVDGKDAAGKDAESKARIVYTPIDPETGEPVVGADGKPVEEKVATLNDGLKFVGNDGKEVVKKLNETLAIKGGLDNNQPASAKNVRVDNENGELIVKIAENPEFNSVVIGTKDPANPDAKVNPINMVSLPGDENANTLAFIGRDKDGKSAPVKIANVESGLKPYTAENAPDTNKKAAGLVNLDTPNVDNSNVATVGDLRNMGWVVSAQDGYSDTVKNANEVKFVGEGAASVTGETKDGVRTIKVKVDSEAIRKDIAGSISNNEDGTVKLGDANGDKADGNKLATTGDVVNAINNSGWNIKGKDADGKDITQLVKPGSNVSFADGKGTKAVTSVDKDGNPTVKIDIDADTVADNITKGEINVVAEGDKAGTVAAKAGDENKVVTANEVAEAINGSGWKATVGRDDADFEDQAGKAAELINPGETVSFNSGKNLKVKQDGNNITYALADDVEINTAQVGGPGKDGKDGKDGFIGVNGKDGKAGVALNGKDGSIGLRGPKGADGKDGLGADLKIGEGPAGVDGKDAAGKDAESKARIVYTPIDPETGEPAVGADGKPVEEKVATLNDGLKFVGNDGKEVVKKLNETLAIKGGLDNNKPASAKNVRVDNENGELIVKIAEKPEFTGVTVKDGDNVVNFNTTEPNTLKLGGTDNAAVTIANVKGNLPDTYNADAVNTGNKPVTKSQELPQGVENKVNNAATVGDVLNAGFNLQANGQAADFVKPYDTVNFADGKNTKVRIDSTPDGKVNTVRVDVDLEPLNKRIGDVEKEGRAGIAGATAMTNLPQVTLPGASMVAAGVGHYKGQSALAIGVSRLSDGGNWIVKAQASANTKGDFNVGAGIGYQWR